MGLTFRKRKAVVPDTSVNVSKGGASISRRFGPISLSSRGRGSVRLGKGLGFRFKI